MIKCSSIRCAPGIAIRDMYIRHPFHFVRYVIKNMFLVGTCADSVGYTVFYFAVFAHDIEYGFEVKADQVRLPFSC